MNEYVVDLGEAEYLDSSALGMLLVLREERAPARWKQVRDGTPLGELSGAHARIDATLARERAAAQGH